MSNAFASYPSLSGRVVFISGGASGIGATLVEEFVAQGSRVAFIDIDVPAAEALVARLTEAFPNAPLFLHCDVTDITGLREAIKTVEERLGPIQVLLNNAANDRRHKLEETTAEDWDALVAVNLRHQFFAAQAVLEGMRKSGGGSIINVRFDQLDEKDRRHAGVHRLEGRRPGPDPLPRAGVRPLQHPRQYARARLGHDGEAVAPVGGRRSGTADRGGAVPAGTGAACRHRTHGLVPGSGRQPHVHRQRLHRRRRLGMTTAIAEVELVADCRNTLGEGVLWSAEHRRVYWTDIAESKLWELDPGSGKTAVWSLSARLGSFALCGGTLLLLALEKQLAYFDLLGRESVVPLVEVEPDIAETRSNDGRCDRAGNFVFGTINERFDGRPLGSFYQFSRKGVLKRLALRHVQIANSICFSPDGRTLYYCDSPLREIHCCRYDPATGQVSEQRVFAVLDKYGRRAGRLGGRCGGLPVERGLGRRLYRALPSRWQPGYGDHAARAQSHLCRLWRGDARRTLHHHITPGDDGRAVGENSDGGRAVPGEGAGARHSRREL